MSAGFTALALLGLAACTSGRSSDALRSVAAEEQSAPAGGASFAAGADPAGAIARIRMHAVVGAPDSASSALGRGLSAQAMARQIALLDANARQVTHDMKGYFSALTEGGTTTVIYVWDVFDPSGNRVHRIQGQLSAPGSSPDGWSSVSASLMETIGQRTMDEFSQWLAARS